MSQSDSRSPNHGSFDHGHDVSQQLSAESSQSWDFPHLERQRYHETGVSPMGCTKAVLAMLSAIIPAVANFLLILAVNGSPPSARAAGTVVGSILLPVVLTAVATWVLARRAGWPFWKLVLVAFPFFFALRAVAVVIAGAGH